MALLLHTQGDAPQDGPVARRLIPPDAVSICPERHIQHLGGCRPNHAAHSSKARLGQRARNEAACLA